MKTKRVIAILLAVCLLTALLAGCGSRLRLSKVEKDPMRYLKAGYAAVEETWGGGKLAALLPKLLENGSVAITAYMQDAIDISGVLTFSGDILGLDVYGDAGTAPMDLKAYFDKKELVVSSVETFGDPTAYSLNLREFAAQGGASPLAQLMGLDEEKLANLEESLDKIESSVGWSESYKKFETESMKEMSEFLSDAELTTAETKLTIDGAEVDAISITVPITRELYEKILGEYMSQLQKLMAMTVPEGQDPLAFLDDMSGSIVYYLNKETGDLMEMRENMTMTLNGEKTTVEANVSFGKDPRAGKLALTTVSGGNGLSVHMDGTLQKSETGLTGEFSGSEENDPFRVDMKLDYNRASGEYVLDAAVEGDSVVLRGTCTATESEAEFSLTSIKASGVTIDTDLRLRATLGAETPIKPESIDLLALSEEKLLELGAKAAPAPAAPAAGTPCDICGQPATQITQYLGATLNVCDSCAYNVATVVNGSYCDICWTESEKLQSLVENGVTYRICPSCWSTITGQQAA